MIRTWIADVSGLADERKYAGYYDMLPQRPEGEGSPD